MKGQHMKNGGWPIGAVAIAIVMTAAAMATLEFANGDPGRTHGFELTTVDLNADFTQALG